MDLMTTLGDETNPDPDSVRGMLAAAVAEAERLTTEIGICRGRDRPHG